MIQNHKAEESMDQGERSDVNIIKGDQSMAEVVDDVASKANKENNQKCWLLFRIMGLILMVIAVILFILINYLAFTAQARSRC